MELQQGWHQCNGSNDNSHDEKETTYSKTFAHEGVTERQEVQPAREDEVDELLTNRFGKVKRKADATMPEGNDGGSGPGQNNTNTDNNVQEFDGRRRSSLEIQDLLAQRFGSIRK